MSFAGEHDDIARLRYLACEPYRKRPFWYGEKILSLLLILHVHRQLLEDLQSVLGIGIIVGGDQDIAVLVCYLSHDRPLRLIPAPGCSKQGYESARSFYLTEVIERLLKRIRRVSEIYEIVRSFPLDRVHPSVHRFEVAYRLDRLFDRHADLEDDAERCEDIVDVEFSEELDLHIVGFSEIAE